MTDCKYDFFLNVYNTECIEKLGTGILQLDRNLDGGILKGSIADFRGETSSGKTLVALSIIKSNINKNIIYINANKKYNKDFLIKFNIDPSKIIIIDTNEFETIMFLLFKLIPDRKADIIVIDDIASIISSNNRKENFGNLLINYIDRIQWCVSRYKSLLVFINQNRNIIGTDLYIAQKILNKKARYIFNFFSKSNLRYENEYVGEEILIKVNKPLLENDLLSVKTFYNCGINKCIDVIESGIKFGVLTKKANWIYYKDVNLGNGLYNSHIFLINNKDIYIDVYKDIKKIMGCQNG